MAIPTITSVTPANGHTGGRTLVEIDGTNFRLPTVNELQTGPTPPAPPSVLVTFGGTPARAAFVRGTTTIWVQTPIHDPGLVDVVVTNIDDAGTPIAGETGTLVGGYTFVRPDLTAESDLVRIIRTFIDELKRQITPNVTWPVSTDYDDATDAQNSISRLPSLPGLVLAEVTIEENKFFSKREPETVQVDGDNFIELAPPTTVDIVMTLVGISDNSTETLNLAAAIKRFFKKNIVLTMNRDGTDPSAGTIDYEMDCQEEPDLKITIASNADNLRHWAGFVRIRGFDIESMAGIATGGPSAASEATTDKGQTATDVVLKPTPQIGS